MGKIILGVIHSILYVSHETKLWCGAMCHRDRKKGDAIYHK
jgi:hypothetical protein